MGNQVNLSTECSDMVLANYIGIFQDIIGVLQIVIPILLMVGLSIELVRMMMNPDEKKYPKAMKNRIIAAVLFFFVPMLVDVVLSWLPNTFDLSSCWEAAKESGERLDNDNWNPVIDNDTWITQLENYLEKTSDNPVHDNSIINSDNSNSSNSSGAPYSTQYQIVEYAKTFVGNKYIWGGNDPHIGADCSGFVKYVYNHFGYNLPRTTSTLRAAVERGELKTVDESEIQIADIVLYSSHVAILTGNGTEIVHAASTRSGITLGSTYAYQRPIYFIRVV